MDNFNWNPFSPGYFENPYKHLKECRTSNPIQKNSGGDYFFFNYEDVYKHYKNKNFLASDLSGYLKSKEPYLFQNTDACPYLAVTSRLWPMYKNGDRHKEIRSALAKTFNTYDLEGFAELALEKTNKQFRGAETLNLVDYCTTFNFELDKLIFNLDVRTEVSEVVEFTNAVTRVQDVFVPKQVLRKINTTFEEGKQLFNKSEFKNRLVSYLPKYKDNPADLYSIESISLMASLETSRVGLTLGLLEVLSSPDLTALVLESETEKLGPLVDELFRLSSPVQYSIRINTEVIDYESFSIPAGSKLFLGIASANRDEKVFEDPDSVKLDRGNTPHLSFGAGDHFCLGAGIARQNMKNHLKAMVKFLQGYKTPNLEDITWARQIFVRTPLKIELKK